MAGENLDLSSDSSRKPGESSATNASSASRKFLGVQFNCCSVYSRVYINREGTAYVGNCPRCGKPVRLKIGSGGTDARFFTAY